MKLAIVGSRSINNFDLSEHVSSSVSEIVSGGANGVDTVARNYAVANNLPIIEIKPQYELYGRAAPIKRNYKIVDSSDEVLCIWDGKSKGAKSVIDYCVKIGKPYALVMVQ